MARFENIPESHHAMLKGLPCPAFEKTAWVSGPPLKNRRIAIVTTAGLHRRGLSDDRIRYEVFGSEQWRPAPVAV